MKSLPRGMLIALFLAVGWLPQLLVGTVTADDEIKQKQSQLDQLRREINKYEERIKQQEKREHATLELLENYDRQANLLQKLIAKLHDQEVSLQQSIGETRNTIDQLSGQLSFIKRHYAHYVTAVYKYGRMHDLELLLSSNSLNQLLVRSEYLKRFSEQRKKDVQDLGTRRDEFQTQNDRLQQQLVEQSSLIAEKKREEATFALKAKKRKALLAEIRRDKNNFKREIDRRKQDYRELESLIAKLIEEDRARTEREKAPPSSASTSAFEARRGHLPWPVNQGTLASRFGTHEHPTLHTITQNTGIDISVPSGTVVTAVADGEVSKIYWLPSFGNLVILNHHDGFRTVYAHLSEISVNEGDKVHQGDQIGKSGEALSGALLHFELYKDREKQDPELWLSPRGLSQR